MASPLVKTLLIVGGGATVLWFATRPKDEEALAEEAAWGGSGGEMGIAPPPGETMADSDGDGVPDVYDVFPTDPTRSGYEQPSDPTRADRDGDGVPDHLDAFPDASGKTGYETYKASFWEGPVGSNLAFAGTLAATGAAGAGIKAGFNALRTRAARLPVKPTKSVRLSPRITQALTKVSGIKPATATTKLAPRLARGAGRLAAPLVVAEGTYTGVRNLWDTGKAVTQAASGDREAALRNSSRAVQRGTQFLTLGSVNVNLHKGRVKLLGRKVASW